MNQFKLIALLLSVFNFYHSSVSCRHVKPLSQSNSQLDTTIRNIIRESPLSQLIPCLLTRNENENVSCDSFPIYTDSFPSFAQVEALLSLNGIKYSLIINEEKFCKLTYEEQKFVINHELGHLKQHHCLKAVLCECVDSAIGIAHATLLGVYVSRLIKEKNTHTRKSLANVLSTYCTHNKLIKFLIPLSTSIFGYLLMRCLTMPANRYYMRCQEYEADKEAFIAGGKDMGSANSAFEKRETLFGENQETFLNKIRADHPSNSARINYLKSLI